MNTIVYTKNAIKDIEKIKHSILNEKAKRLKSKRFK